MLPLPDGWLEVRDRLFPELTAPQFLHKVCNEGVILPEHKIDGIAWHLPASWLGHNPQLTAFTPEATPQLGWRQTKYLFILPAVHPADVESARALSPGTRLGAFMASELKRAEIDPREVVATHLVRFALPDHIKSPLAQHKSAGKALVIADVENCKPDVIVSFGADCAKALFGHGTKMDSVRGEVLEYDCEDGTKIPVIPAGSPLQFLGGHADISVFRLELRRAKQVAEGRFTRDLGPLDYRLIDTVDGVRKLIAELDELQPRHVAYDTEFGNDCAREEFTYTVSIQLAWGKGKAAFVQLRKQEKRTREVERKKGKKTWLETEEYTVAGLSVFSPEEEAEVWQLVGDYLRRTKRVDAHHLRVDVEQAFRNKQDIDARVEDGFDTMLVHHLLYGDESQGLDYLTHKYLPQYGAYWRELEDWLSENGRKAHLRFGYRDIPVEILFPYGCKDVDTTWQLAEILEQELEDIPALKSLYWSLVAPTSLGLLEMERQGLLVDDERRMELRERYLPVYDGLKAKLREMIQWPDFNPGSKDQLSYILFSGTDYKDKHKGEAAYRAALAAGHKPKVLNLTPLLNTDKYPRQWVDIEMRGEQHKHSPSTKATTIDLMAQAYPDEPVLAVLKQLSVVGKFITTYLRPVELNEFGVPKGGKGFHQNIWSDGRVRTRISQLTETGRYTSKSANLQVWPKKQEPLVRAAYIQHAFGITAEEYDRRTFKGKKNKKTGEWDKPPYSGPDRIPEEEQYHHTIFKSCVVARPGYKLIEADFKTAELFIWGYSSGDKRLIAVLAGGRDLHSEVAAIHFNLPGKDELLAILARMEAGDATARADYDAWVEPFKKKYEAERTAAKAVIFGVMYGRGANALARAVSQAGNPTTPEQCQKIIDGLAESFPVAWAWLKGNQEHAVTNGWVATAFGRRRYFSGVQAMTDSDRAAVKREASNSGIQGCVADLLSQAIVAFYRLKKRTAIGATLDFRVLLPIHDALLFEVREDQVELFKPIIRMCMGTMNKIPGTDYYLDVDVEVMERWGEKH